MTWKTGTKSSFFGATKTTLFLPTYLNFPVVWRTEAHMPRLWKTRKKLSACGSIRRANSDVRFPNLRADASFSLSAAQLFAAADERPYAGPALKRLVLCKPQRFRYVGAWRPLAAERKIG